MKKILFDLSHEELLQDTESQEARQGDSWGIMKQQVLEAQKDKFGWEVTYHNSTEKKLDEKLQEDEPDVLVLIAPKKALDFTEIYEIIDFVKSGKSLLFAYDYNCLWHQQYEEKQNTTNLLLEAFGLQVEQLLSRRPDEVFNLQPHYLSTEVTRLSTYKPVYFKTLNDEPYILANLPETNKAFLATVDLNPGRVISIGDYVLFSNRQINEKDNRQFIVNAFRWLTYTNPVDCNDASIATEVTYGKTAKYSITLSNPHQKRLERINCLLESDTGVLINNPVIEIRSIPPGGKNQVIWEVNPQKLGKQTLRLTIDFHDKNDSIFLDYAGEFQCLPDAEIDLIFRNPQGEAQELIETGIPFEVQAITRWANNAKQTPLELELHCPLAHTQIEKIDNTRWRLVALDEGQWKITLKAKEINQQVTRLIHAYPSSQSKIAGIEQEIVSPLASEVHRKVCQIRSEFDVYDIQQIAFRLFTPEEQVRLLYQGNVTEHLLEAINTARTTTERFLPLVDELLRYIAPSYSPIHGCCIPYDPKLAAHLAKANPTRKEHLAYNFLCMDGNDRYGQTWLEGNIAALLLHEKYGHGFFYTQTTIGKQLAILYRHGLLRNVDYEYLQFPYPQSLQAKYARAIQALNDSTLIVNEGFATWLELTVLNRMAGQFNQTVYRRKEFLFKDTSLETLQISSNYFQRQDPYKPSSKSKYEEGWQSLESIESLFGPDFGPKCAVQAVIKATDVNLGIVECGGQIQFGLEAESLEQALLEAKSDDARTDMRLKRIELVLDEFKGRIQEEQERLKCNKSCLHSECPLNKIVSERLGW
ncbi:hypothetical protein [Nostoc sp. FACHB-280]|uniref:hypothetical protein n=1 Tax=Nostoc sp. FACHB-280 TaxID=2692839 RepID=UPI00168A8B40|nr:hypothetical protein [Nostoc sp. FACHB-280]MBD2497752.1 hypothetical protein [Nostoc sp. FACHB-280]